MKIKIPGKGPIAIYGDGMFISIPGDEVVEVSEAAAGGGPSAPALLIDTTYFLKIDPTYYLLIN